jgi:diguanylate cyclase (GGDEF)-like protein
LANDQPLRDQDRRLIRLLTVAYVLGLAVIAALSASVHVILDGVIARQADSAVSVNVAGRQRMLSQRIALFSTRLFDGDAGAVGGLAAAIDLMESSHRALLAADGTMGIVTPPSGPLLRHYREPPVDLDARVRAFLEDARALAAAPDGPEAPARLARIQSAAGDDLLADLDRAVQLYEQTANARIDNLRTVQRIVLAILLLVLVAEALLVFRPLVRKVADFAGRLVTLATVDPLTGVLNRRALMETAAREMARSARTGRPPAVIAADIDRFKAVNDAFGHDGGDAVLRGFAETVRGCLRETDAFGRIGGEEFVAILPETGAQGALLVAERLRRAVAAGRYGERGIAVTVSLGVAIAAPADASVEAVITRADRALYEAKRAGRDRVVLAEEAAGGGEPDRTAEDPAPRPLPSGA